MTGSVTYQASLAQIDARRWRRGTIGFAPTRSAAVAVTGRHCRSVATPSEYPALRETIAAPGKMPVPGESREPFRCGTADVKQDNGFARAVDLEVKLAFGHGLRAAHVLRRGRQSPAYLEKAGQLIGHTLVPPTTVERFGLTFAFFASPEGHIAGLSRGAGQ
jgi:hypothetical protein